MRGPAPAGPFPSILAHSRPLCILHTATVLTASSPPIQFEIEYKPFRLNSDLPIEPPVDRAEFFGNKFGARYEPARAMFKGMADSLGLPL